MVFCVNLAHVAKVTEAFCAAGVDARAVSSKTPAARRAAFVTDFKAGKFPVLVNCSTYKCSVTVHFTDMTRHFH